MSSKSRSRTSAAEKTTNPVLLGIPDGSIKEEEDVDPYVTKIGGVPVWLQPDQPPSKDICHCKNCGSLMYLIFQGYVPLPDSIYHRVIYVWGCNRRQCMHKSGSFSVLRAHLVDKEYLKTVQKKAQAKKKKQQQRQAVQKQKQQSTNSSPFGNFQLGDLWTQDPPVAMNHHQQPLQQTTPIINTAFGKEHDNKNTANDVADIQLQFGQMSLNPVVSDPVSVELVPRFPGEYLHVIEEDSDQDDRMMIDMQRYGKYLDLEKRVMEEMESDDGQWQGETYEKQQLPRGMDKEFKAFLERVEIEPRQCVRYEWAGQPLLYNRLQQQTQPLGGYCTHCKSPRVFELQLMPHILYILPTEEGMEFGTILVFVCKNDCHPGHPEQVSYVQEEVIVQFEYD